VKRPHPKPSPSKQAPNGGPGRLASDSEYDDGTVDPNDSGGKPVPTVDEPRLEPQIVPPPNVGSRP
jgi:hypothetical protein